MLNRNIDFKKLYDYLMQRADENASYEHFGSAFENLMLAIALNRGDFDK